MFLKINENKVVKKSKRLFRKILSLLSTIFFLGSVSMLIIFFSSGFWKENKSEIIDRFDKYGLLNLRYAPEIIYHIVRSPFYSKDKIYIDIKFENLLKLDNARKSKLKNLDTEIGSSLLSDPKILVGAKIKFNKSKLLDTKIRIKGDRKIHFEDADKTSYKINIKNKNLLSGMSEFSIIKPRARNYLDEWIFHEFLKEAELLNIRYEFAKVYINGSSQGIYAIEEGYTEQLTERNNLRYGPIFSLNEELSTDPTKTIPSLYNQKFWNKTETRKYISEYANSKLLNFFQSKLKLDDVMDIDKWSSYFAIVDLNQSIHGALAKSVKFYYNPLTSKFEPIGYDAHYIKKKDQATLGEIFFKRPNELPPFFIQFFSNKEFYLQYLKKLKKYSSKKFLNNFFEKRESKIKKINSLIYSDYFFNDYVFFFGPGIYYFDKIRFYKRSKYISDYLIIDQKKIAYYNLNDKYYLINNNFTKFLKFKSIICEDLDIIKKKKIDKNFLSHKSHSNDITKIIPDNSCKELILKDTNDNEISLRLSIYNNYYLDKKFDKEDYKKIFIIDEKDKSITIKNNYLEIRKNIFIPKGYTVKLMPGDKISIKNNAFIISKSQWIVKGTKEKPIIISGSDNNNGGGIYIYDHKNKNFFENVYFKNLSGVKRKNIAKSENLDLLKNFNLLGSLNFYNTKVELANVHFTKIFSEDALNIISSKFLLDNIFFNNIASDAIDIDFGIGTMNNIYCRNIKNDALDYSKSKIKLNNIFAENIGDKVISAGENSQVDITNLTAINSKIVIASKDGSIVNLKNFNLEENMFNFTSYIKKIDYKTPILNVFNTTKIKFTDEKILKDKNSKIYFNSIEYKINKKNSLILKKIYN